MCASGNRRFGQFLKGGLIAPPFFRRRKFRPPPPSTCNNVYNAESCSTVFPSIYGCSTGLGAESGRVAVLSSRVDTRYGGGDPATRACLRFCCGKRERFPISIPHPIHLIPE